MEDVTDREGAETSGEPELSQAERVKRQGGGGSNAGGPGAGGPPPTAPEPEPPSSGGPDVPLTKRGREAAAAELEPELQGEDRPDALTPEERAELQEAELEEELQEGDDQDLQEEGAEIEAAGVVISQTPEPELTGESGELEGDLQAGEPAEIASELPESPESDDLPPPGGKTPDDYRGGAATLPAPVEGLLTPDEVGDLEMWAVTLRDQAEEFSRFVATLSGRLEDLRVLEGAELEAEGEDAPRPGWRQRLKDLSSSTPDQDDAK